MVDQAEAVVVVDHSDSHPPTGPRILAEPDRDLLLDPAAQSHQTRLLADLDTLAERVLGFQNHYNTTAEPFAWTWTRTDLNAYLKRLDTHTPQAA